MKPCELPSSVFFQDGHAELAPSFPKLCLEARRWEKRNIPFASPQIALDIALYATAARLEGQPIASKTVHLTVGYSADRVREVLMELERGGWISKLPHRRDRRIRLIEATDKLVALMLRFEDIKRAALSQVQSDTPPPPGLELVSRE
jgi:hypothetical protein